MGVLVVFIISCDKMITCEQIAFAKFLTTLFDNIIKT